jgi:glycosyltransferase involved in cell wall biosynthesis
VAALTPENVQFALLSFEGPDRYAAAGGLAVRVRELSQALAAAGFTTHLFFVGDPHRPGVETSNGVHLHRWAQGLSAWAPAGVYDDEERKIEDMCRWLPDHLADLVAAGAARGLTTVLLAEEWQTMWPLSCVHDALVARGLRHRALLAWNANNKFGFERIDWSRLRHVAEILTISRHMKHLLWRHGVNPLVVPNGIPTRWLDVQPPAAVAALRQAFPQEVLIAKVGRWDPDKRWQMAIETLARLREQGRHAVLVARGWKGSEAAARHYTELRSHAISQRLSWGTVDSVRPGRAGLVETMEKVGPEAPDILELTFPLPDEQLRLLYGAADAVLANSGFEPFGLVGLEVMASRGIAITGSTGEDFMVSFHNGFALDSDNPDEIVHVLDWLQERPERPVAMRKAARETAKLHTWPHVVERLLFALQFAVIGQGVEAGPE